MTTINVIYELNNKNLVGDGVVDEGVPEENLSARIEQIRLHYAPYNKELVTCSYTVIKPKKEGEPTRVVFAKKVGTKGAEVTTEAIVEALSAVSPFEPQAVQLLRQYRQQLIVQDPLQIANRLALMERAAREANSCCALIDKMVNRCQTLPTMAAPRVPRGF